jgi:hypothetical protein
MSAEASVTVPDRLPGSDIMQWMTAVQNRIGYDHAARSPLCRASKMEYAKIPVEDGAGIGERATRQ